MNETNAEPYPGQFRIVWNRDKAEYRLNIPNYEGGEVVPLETVKSLEAHQSARIAELERRVQERERELKELKQQYEWRMEDIAKIRAAFIGITPEDSLIDFAAKTSAELLRYSASGETGGKALAYDAVCKSLGVEKDCLGVIASLRAEVEALNGKLTAAILGSQAEVERLTKERDEAIENWRHTEGLFQKTTRRAADLTKQLAEREEDRAHGCGIALIRAERERQISQEGWTPEHDDGHNGGELAMAASAYAVPWFCRVIPMDGISTMISREFLWPDEDWSFKPHNGIDGLKVLTKEERASGRIRDLVKAGALIAAEIDRLQRAAIRAARAQP